MAVPAILYHSILDDGTLSVTTGGTASGFDLDDLKLRNPDARWRSDGSVADTAILIDAGAGGTAVNTLAITGHNLSTAGTPVSIVVRRGTTSSTLTGALTLAAADSDSTLWRAWGNVSVFRFWDIRFNFSAPCAIEIGAIALGRRLNFTEYMERGFDPVNVALQYRANIARGGAFAGGIAKTATRRMPFKFGPYGLSRPDFHDDTGLPSKDQFMREHWSNGRAFWFAKDSASAGLDPIFVPRAEKSKAPIITSARAGWGFEPVSVYETA